VAYFSSIVVLALAAIQPPSSDGTGQETTYFDYVVFLTMFLLAGEWNPSVAYLTCSSTLIIRPLPRGIQ
jgi:hypothetical protein